MELAQALIQAAQSASQAAQAATTASAAQTGGGDGPAAGGLKKDLAKLIPRPNSFNPVDREQEVLQWRDWYWGFKQYLLVVDGAYQEEVERIEKDLTSEVDWELLSEAEQQRGHFLYSLLGSLVQGRLIGLVRNVENFNGYEALRQLLSNCQPNARNRTMSLLQGIMAYPSFNMRISLLPQILKLEEHYYQYEKLGGKLNPDMKAAILLRSIGGQMKMHLNLALNKGSTYAQIREAIIAYDNATTKWNEAGALSFTSPTTSGMDQGPMPMEVDRLQQKGKDKGKSKGKEQKGKSKGKVDKGKDKGKGKSDGGAKNGKGKGGKEKGGKGKSTSEVCWTCGKPGHMSKDCWRVRQVEAPPAPSVTSSSQQGSMTATTTTSTTSGGDGASKAIRRVSQPAVFDLRETELTGSIRMIQESPRSSVEFYSIATDEENEDEQDMDYVINTIQHQSDDMEVDDQGSENEETISVIVDSGADASLFPGHLMGKGKPVMGVCPYLQDAQGTKIQTYGHSDVDIVMHSKEGREVIVKERVTFSDMVSQPILSYGRLLRTGWSIDGKTQCLKHGEIEIPLVFQNQSVVVRAHIRMIHEPSSIRTLKVRLGSELQETAVGRYGWQKKGDFWLGVHSSRHYQTPQFAPGFKDQVEGLCRSTLVERRGQWELVEMAEPLDGLWEQEEPIEELKEEERSRVMTFIAPSGTVPETFGFEVMDGFHFKSSPEGMEELAVPEAMEDEEVEGVDIPGGERVPGASLEDQEARLEIGVAVPSQLQVNGIVLTLESPLRSLRAACAFYRIGQSGGKQKCFNRLMAHQHQLELLMARDLAAQGRATDERIPVEQASAREPTVEERRQHELTHLPYQPWCTACLKHRARQGQHRRTGKSHEQGCPTVSFDFCYVKSSGSGAIGEEAEDGAQAGLEVERGALLLIAVCSQTGYLLALPVKSKNQMSLITHELLAFTQVLGHEEVQYYSDNEPTLRQILKLLVNARSSMGLKTTMRTTKIYDSAGNGLVENAIQRIRSLAATLMESLAERIELKFQSQHPIWSWACRHSAWLINRFQPFHGSTSYELAHGRSYEGKLCNFGEICFAYCKPKQGFKADPKWRIGIYLGKTEIQDNWAIGDVNRVYLSRSMRRMADASKKNLMCYKGFTAYSWEYQQNFGGRIVPSKRMASMVGMPMSQALPPSSVVSPDDVDAQEILAFVKSYAGKREEAKDLIDEAPTQEKGNVNDGPSNPEERKLAEDKRKDYVEEEIPELVKVTSPMAVDEGRNQAGPSNPHHRHLHAPSTPRSAAQKTVSREREEVEGKKMKMTIEKPMRQLEAPTPEPKRLKHQEEPNTERRVEITQVGENSYYHMDYIIGEEELAVWNYEDEEEDEASLEIPEALWSNAPLDRVPPDPPRWIDDLADEVEEKRLERLGVITPLEKKIEGYKDLTTRFVRDWRAKPRTNEPGAPKQFLRRSRLVAREYANDRRDDVHSPATGGQALRLLPAIYLMKREEEEHGGPRYTLGALDIKDAFLQVPQAVPTQVSTASGHFEVKRNLPGQRIGAKAWFEYLTNWLGERGFIFSQINPCLGRCGQEMMLLIHVDDVMFVGEHDYVVNKFIPDLRQSFEIAEQHLTGMNSSFQFLRRTYVEMEKGLKVMPGKYAEQMVEAYEEQMGRVKSQKLPCGQEVLEPDGSVELKPELASLYRSLVGCGIYLSQERPDVSYTIKELASTMSRPTSSSLKKLGKLVGYLKSTMGQYSVLEVVEPGHGLVSRTVESRWLLETFSDSDWSGSKSHRRSTSAAIHMLNGMMIFSSSRGQKSVALSSAEAELNALVSSAADGIYLKRCLEFLVEEAVRHECLVDNSAALHLCHRRGPGKLRHIAGKLLWIQDLVAQEELQVKAVGTTYNVADLGTKPLSRSRITLILYWCNTRSSTDERIGEEELARLEESKVNGIKINKLAKLLNRILLFGGLEQVTAERSEVVEEIPSKGYGTMIFIMVLMLMVTGLALAVWWLWRVVEELKVKIADAKDSAYVNGVSTRAYVQGMREEMKTMKGYIERIHRGLVKASGYVDSEDVKEEDWKHWDYLQRSNRDFDWRRLHAQIKAYKEACEKDDGPIDLRPYRNTEDETMEGEETVTVRLDSGEVVEIPIRFIETREPESEEDAPTAEMDVTEQPEQVEWAEEDLPVPESRIEDPTVGQATSSWITKDEFNALAEFDGPEARSGLRAKQHMLKLHDEWAKADREGNHERKLEVYKMMDVHFPFMDSASLPF